jgi:hypothetical protein
VHFDNASGANSVRGVDGGMGDWATDEGEAGREGFDSHLVIWSVGLTQFPDQALFPNKLAVLDLRYNKITRCPDTHTQTQTHTHTCTYA